MTAVGRHALVGSNPTPGAITSGTPIVCQFLRNLGKARASPIRLRKSGSMLYSNVRAVASRRLLFLAILIIVVGIITGVGWALYNQMQSASNAASQPNILLSNHATLTYPSSSSTSPTYSSTWQIHLNSGKNIQVAIRTDYQVYLSVEYDCSGYNTNIATARCTLVPPVGFNPSGNDSSNSTSFTTVNDSTYFFTISLFQQNPPAANGQSLGPVNVQIVAKQLS